MLHCENFLKCQNFSAPSQDEGFLALTLNRTCIFLNAIGLSENLLV